MSLLEPDAALGRKPEKMSEEQFLCLDGVWAEWVDGVTLFMSPVSVDHDQVAGWVAGVLRMLAEEKSLGTVLAEPFIVKLPGQRRMRSPDVLFISKANTGNLQRSRFIGAPDLIAEIVSRDSAKRDTVEKRAEYERAGVREYLIIDPIKRAAALLRLDGDGKYREVPPVGGRLISEVVGGFFFEPRWLRSLPLPSQYRTVQAMGL
jgi:Uma2 family endonuclease